MADTAQFNLGNTSQRNLLTSLQQVHDDNVIENGYYADNLCETKSKQVVEK